MRYPSREEEAMRPRLISSLVSLAVGGAALAGVCASRVEAQVLSTTAPKAPSTQAAAEPPAQHDARMAWWRQARFGMFIHWGIYAVPAQGEWYMTNAHVPRERYAEYARQFDPVKFGADRWAQIAHDAGMKYLVIASKHHDGFTMLPTTTARISSPTSRRSTPTSSSTTASRAPVTTARPSRRSQRPGCPAAIGKPA